MAENALGLASVVLGSGVVASVFTLAGNFALTRWSDASKAARIRTYAALRISITLEEFAGTCAEWVNNYQMISPAPQFEPMNLPAFPPFPSDLDWREIDAGLVDRALSLENLVRLTNVTLDHSAQQFGAQTAASECCSFCAELGWDAWKIATDMRVKHHLKPFASLSTWDFPGLLEREASAIRERRLNAKPWGMAVLGSAG